MVRRCSRKMDRSLTGAPRRRTLYREAAWSSNRQEITNFDHAHLSRPRLDDADHRTRARSDASRALEQWANPSSPHGEGRKSRALLEEARTTLAEALGWRHDVIFTSGASESVEIAARWAKIEGRAHGATEHPIVGYAMGARSTVLPVDRDGLIDEAALDTVLANGRR